MTGKPDEARRSPSAPPITAAELLRTHRIRLGYSSQEAFAHEHGYSHRSYSDMENGGKISMGAMYALREQLQMSPEAKDQLFQLVTGAPPALSALKVDPALDRITARWADVHVHTQQDPVILMDGGWNMRHFNRAWAQIVDDLPPHPDDHPLTNPMRFLLFHPDAARMHPGEKWLVTAVTQFAQHYDLHPDNPYLQDMRRRIRENDLLEDLYTNRVRQELTDRGTDVIHQADVDERTVVIHGEAWKILLTTMIPWHARHYGYQLMKLSLIGRVSAGSDTPTSLPSAQWPPTAGPSSARHAAALTNEPLDRPSPNRALTAGQLLRAYRHRARLSQDAVLRFANLPVKTARTLRAWEADKAAPKPEYIPRLAAALNMSVWVQQYLEILVTKGDPPTLGVRGGPEVEARCAQWARQHVADQASPTVLTDGAWNVIHCNSAYRQLFHHVPEDPLSHPTVNWLRYLAFCPDARETLVNWYEDWLIPGMADFGATLMRHAKAPHPEHVALLEEFKENPLLWDVYTQRARQELEGSGTAFAAQGDGDVRRIRIPARGDTTGTRMEISVLITAGIPLHGKPFGYRLNSLTPCD
ncbi:hypothetical protein [Streptomyces sp. NPDC029704]|uniref:helix-turn-helix domain-containing protein n=1 Tax=Streptomyces sp. NPDC029704 TaxID=3156920 RepID=UPI0033F4BD64